MWWSSIASAGSSFAPPAATEIASQVDDIYGFLLVASFISFVMLIGGMIWFVFKYRRQSANDKTAYITHNHTAEFLWSFIPFLIFMFSFGWGWIVYHKMRTFPDDALEVHVVGKKWAWRFLYKNGKEVTAGLGANNQVVPATMVVPVDRPVKLIMSSEKINPAGNDPTDRPVLHSFFIPSMRIKQDVVPGRYSSLWFQAEKTGEFQVFCAEYCGENHWGMQAKIRVVTNEEFEQWLASEGSLEGGLAGQGKSLYATKACIGCHSLDGARLVGPSFKGLFNSMQKLDDGKSVKADENFIRESIINSNATIIEGYPRPSLMPAYAGQLSDDEIAALIEFIKSIK